jgi:hypothetical protein|tara:strand:- start:1583 stop:1837 length:255 start_codon:yes stop_codon:yes gene_type:complete
MERLVIYQKKNNFVYTRKRETEDIDAETLLRNLNKSREQLAQLKIDMREFELDIEIMEKFETIAKKIRDRELEKSNAERNQSIG